MLRAHAHTRAQRRCSLFAFQETIKKAICSCHSCFIVFLSGALTLGDRIKRPLPSHVSLCPSSHRNPPHPSDMRKKNQKKKHMRSGSVYTSSAVDKHSHAQHVAPPPLVQSPYHLHPPSPSTLTYSPVMAARQKTGTECFFFLCFAFWITGRKNKEINEQREGKMLRMGSAWCCKKEGVVGGGGHGLE